jgi:hypothetical protein
MGGGGGILGTIGTIVGIGLGYALAPVTGGTSAVLASTLVGGLAGGAIGTTADVLTAKDPNLDQTDPAAAIRDAETMKMKTAAAEAARLRQRKGAASTIVSGPAGDTSQAPVLKQTLGGS